MCSPPQWLTPGAQEEGFQMQTGKFSKELALASGRPQIEVKGEFRSAPTGVSMGVPNLENAANRAAEEDSAKADTP
jgi:hypothetical protein